MVDVTGMWEVFLFLSYEIFTISATTVRQTLFLLYCNGLLYDSLFTTM